MCSGLFKEPADFREHYGLAPITRAEHEERLVFVPDAWWQWSPAFRNIVSFCDSTGPIRYDPTLTEGFSSASSPQMKM
jgi:hypothetical protein